MADGIFIGTDRGEGEWYIPPVDRPTLAGLKAASAWLVLTCGLIKIERIKQGEADEICRRFGVTTTHFITAVCHITDGLSIPSENFVRARDAADRLNGKPLTYAQLSELVKAVKEQEKQNE
jgi:hypothetical protein